MGKPGHTGIRRIILATRFSAQGLRYAWRNESAFRQEVLLTVVLAPIAFWLGRSAAEVLVLTVPLALVLIVELLNSAIEATVDRISDKEHELAGSAKDMGSAAVFVSLLIVAGTWGTMAWQRFGPA
jgi:diacylglycerol kinase (ATP)